MSSLGGVLGLPAVIGSPKTPPRGLMRSTCETQDPSQRPQVGLQERLRIRSCVNHVGVNTVFVNIPGSRPMGPS